MRNAPILENELVKKNYLPPLFAICFQIRGNLELIEPPP